jgi:ABC-2 type transport system ATP-binding protein
VDYGPHRALDGLNLEVPEGSLCGLLGPNGAGKSTTIGVISTLLGPTQGRVVVGGHNVVGEPEKVRRCLGLVPQRIALAEHLSVWENLQFFGGIQGLRGKDLRIRAERALEVAQLSGHRARAVATLSSGMKRRLNIAVALLHDPEVFVLDEPTAGVDPQSRTHIFETIRALHGLGRTILYTTHYMEEVEALCEQVAILDHGHLLAYDSLAGLLRLAKPTALRVSGRPIRELRDLLDSLGIGYDLEGSSLEQVFLSLTGRALRDAS